MTRLRATAARFPELVGRLGALPRYLTAQVAGTLRCDALPVRFGLDQWRARFLAQWPPGSPGHRSYFTRITRGTHLRPDQAARGGVRLTAG